MSDLAPEQRPPFREALRFWRRLGWISFGGTAAHIAIMHDHLVEKKRWISNESFLHALSHCMILPGPEAQQLAIYIGWKKGGLVAGTLFVLPSMFVLLALSVIYVRFGKLPWIIAMFNGLKPAVISLVILALYRVARRALHGILRWLVAAIAFVSMFFFHVLIPWIMLGAIALGVALSSLRPQLLRPPSEAGKNEDQDDLFMGCDSLRHEHGPVWKALIKLTAIALLLWLMPLSLFYVFGDDFHFWKRLVLFFTKTAL
jgi:chromate transporter